MLYASGTSTVLRNPTSLWHRRTYLGYSVHSWRYGKKSAFWVQVATSGSNQWLSTSLNKNQTKQTNKQTKKKMETDEIIPLGLGSDRFTWHYFAFFEAGRPSPTCTFGFKFVASSSSSSRLPGCRNCWENVLGQRSIYIQMFNCSELLQNATYASCMGDADNILGMLYVTSLQILSSIIKTRGPWTSLLDGSSKQHS